MVINWYGEGCFKIQTGGLTILTDPPTPSSGLTAPRFKPDIALQTETSQPLTYADSSQIIIGPGEYEVRGIEIRGWQTGAKNNVFHTAYSVKAEDLTLVFLGHLAEALPAEALEELGAADILFIPAGGPPFIPQDAAVKLIKQMNPRIVVASFFKIPDLKRSSGDIKIFLDELGRQTTPQEKLVIKKKDLPPTTEVAVLTI